MSGGDRRGTLFRSSQREPRPRVCTVVRMYRSAQRKLISFTVPPCVSPAPNFTVRTGPQKRRSLDQEPVPEHRSLSRRRAAVPAFAVAVINRIPPLHMSAVPVRISGSFEDSCILAQGTRSRKPEKRRIGSSDIHRCIRCERWIQTPLEVFCTRNANSRCFP